MAANSLGSSTGGCSYSPLGVSALGERRALGGASWARGCGCGRWAAAPQPNCQRAWRYWKGLGRVAGSLADSNPGQLYGCLRCWNRRRCIPVGDSTVALFWNEPGLKGAVKSAAPENV